MKKELNGKSRRKWVVGGAMVFGSVALLSTGFATWVIGASNTSSDGQIGVEIDTVSNKSVDFKATIAANDNTIKISDPADSGTNGVVKTGSDDKQDLTVSVDLQLICSDDYLNGNEKPGAVTVKWSGSTNMIPADNLTDVHGKAGTHVNWNSMRSATSKITEVNDAFTVFKDVYIAEENTTTGTEASITPNWNEASSEDYSVKGSMKFTATVSLNFTLGGTDLWKNKEKETEYNTFCDFVNSMYTKDMVGEDKTFTYEAEMNGEIETEMEAELSALKSYFKDTKPTVTLSVNNPAAQA